MGKVQIHPPNLTDIFELRALGKIRALQLEKPLEHDWITRVVSEMLVNVNRCYALAWSLPMFVQHAAVDQYFHCVAQLEGTGKLVEDYSSLSTEDAIATQAVYKRLRAQHNQIAETLGEVQTRAMFALGTQRTNELMGREGLPPNEWMATAIEATLEAVVLGLWTAFEVFSSDLWVNTVNEGPKQIVQNVIANPAIRADGDQSKAQAKQVPISLLAEYDYDLTRAMGEILKEAKKVDFQSLRSTEKAYEVAFNGNLSAIFNASDSDYANVIALSAVRNVLLHQRGRADREFLEKMQFAKACTVSNLREVKECERLLIRGGIAADLYASVLRTCMKLVFAVDQEITTLESKTS